MEVLQLLARYRFWTKYAQEHGGYEANKNVQALGLQIDELLTAHGYTLHMNTRIEYYAKPDEDGDKQATSRD